MYPESYFGLDLDFWLAVDRGGRGQGHEVSSSSGLFDNSIKGRFRCRYLLEHTYHDSTHVLYPHTRTWAEGICP